MAEYCIGVDLGGTFIKFGLLDGSNQVRGIFQLPTPCEAGPDAVVEQMVAGGRRLLEANNIDRRDVLAAGIGAPGPLDITNGITLGMPNLPGFKDYPICARVSEGLAMPAVLENDANAAALGEYLCGAGRGAKSLVMLTLGTGIGSGIIVDGKVLHGAHEIGAELGHVIIEPNGEECGCGQKGCLERYCSATYMAQYAERLIRHQKRPSSLASLLEGGGGIGSRDIQEAAGRGDQLAGEVWDRAAYYLALGCVNICRILDPARIILGGGMANAGDTFLDPMKKHFEKLNWRLVENKTRFAFATLGNNAGVIGAAGVAAAAIAGR